VLRWLCSVTATLDSAKVFAAAAAAAKTTTYKDKVYKYAWDKAQQYVDQQELPAQWDRTQLLGNMDVGDSDEVSVLILCWPAAVFIVESVKHQSSGLSV